MRNVAAMRNFKLRRNKQSLVGPKAALLSIIGIWAFYAIIVSLRAAVLDFPSQAELAQRRIIVAVIGVALTFLLYFILRLFDRKPVAIRITAAFIAAIPCSLAIAAVNYFVFNVYEPISLFEDADLGQKVADIKRELGATAWQEIAEIAVTNYFFTIAWASLYVAMGYAREVREAERAAARFAQVAQNAELRSLRYQVNPHFLFNTLNSLSSLVITQQNSKAEEMIQNLSNFYRTSLSSDPLAEVSLTEEIELQQLYLAIEAVRYPERLRTKIDIDAKAALFKVPAMILQPLVENCIKHAVSRSNDPVTITISSKLIANGIEINVMDDGRSETNIAAQSNGIGLANVRDRLEARYGSAASLTTQVLASGGFIVSIKIWVAI